MIISVFIGLATLSLWFLFLVWKSSDWLNLLLKALLLGQALLGTLATVARFDLLSM